MLQTFLSNKPLFYAEIDYERFPRVYKKIESNFKSLKNIHIVGTNGKGTTGRFLASALHHIGFSVGHYTSPHILKFSERVWLNGASVEDDVLSNAHKKLQSLLSNEDSDSLSYFEYTTLLAMLIFNECDFVVLEAGLGGERDATAVFDKCLTLVTPISFDHEAFLGSSIEEIATTKLNAIQNSAIIGYQNHKEVYEIAQNMGVAKSLNIYSVDELLNDDDFKKIETITKELSLAKYLSQNLSLAISVLNFLGIKYETDDFKNPPLFGRVTKLTENIIIDVGHNALAASAIVEALDGEKRIVVYNSYSDKNYTEILKILKPIISRVEIIEVDDSRIAEVKLIQNALDDLEIKHGVFMEINKEQKYLVFGSFSVVETFLKKYFNKENSVAE
ncbi:bifunctional folylpolyglutamate synthase/dihydrofolate synthase [Sulfurimonas sp.]|uniref:bifunctional folylpolyglutamate synthase/dihydrofolate synthase n=1 Tax=Sulfurimonas sp. TaxID=2022749 RepID=UPI00262E6A2E|nr:bifunctional folylpolyglutamate synthase/dihydrofolate synthase [Sulfurimonas sp.]MDD5158139.1 bifunctional folylpolyglutamate synthase/dihydrofolate synthase [Sulfurimonas sp.]